MNPFSIALPNINDQSVGILDQITGVVYYFIDPSKYPSAPTTFTVMLQHFNEAMLGFGLLIFAILLFVGTMNTAADGQFLGRNWNSVWTPIRIIFGVLFVVPLKTGLCFGQYIFLYLILIGVQIGTYVWDQVVEDVFNNYTPPAVPSYVTNYAMAALENQIILQTVNNIITSKLSSGSGNSTTISVPLSGNYTVGNLPSFVLNLLDQQGEQICNSLYSSPQIESACEQAVNSTLTGGSQGNQTNGQPQAGTSGALDGSITVWVGGGDDSKISLPSGSCPSNPPLNFTTTQNLPNFSNLVSNYPIVQNTSPNVVLPSAFNYLNSWPAPNSNKQSPDGIVQVQGCYNYTFSTDSAPSGSNSNQDLTKQEADFQTNLQQQVEDFTTNTIMTNTDPSTNVCGNDGSGCSLSGIASILVAGAEQFIEANPNSEQSNLNPTICQMVKVRPSSPNSSTNNAVTPIYEQVCRFTNLDTYTVEGMPYINAQNQEVIPTISVPLEGSWWNAGESYLILDDHFSQDLKALVDAIQKNTVNLLGNSNFTSTLFIQTGMMIAEQGAEYAQAYKQNSMGGVNLANSCVDLSLLQNPGQAYSYTDKMICGAGSVIISPAQEININNPSLDMSDLGVSQDSWMNSIEPYMPNIPEADFNNNPMLQNNAVPSSIFSSDPTQASQIQANFYNDLSNIPVQLQGPLEVLLMAAQNATHNAVSSCQSIPPNSYNSHSCYGVIYPYLQNLINVFKANGLLQNSQDTLPVTQAMNDMFDKLLGPEAQNYSDAPLISSVMQDVYNFGVPNGNNVFSQQFSMIQQIRNTGVGMIVGCLESIEGVYESYTTQIQGLITQVNQETDISRAGSEASAAFGTGIAAAGMYTLAGTAAMIPGIGSGRAMGLGFLASAASTTSQVLQAVVELKVATATITTITNIGIQMMWLPLFIFVVVSLFTAGVQFALVIPFMPYIMFWAGQIAWVIGVIEALVAAPIVMLAFAHPGGNDYVGHAAPAVRFLIGIIFRPVLMVIGLITGILLTYVLINYSAQGFHIIADSIFSSLPVGNVMLMGALSCLLLFTYASFLVMAFTKCFSPIYVIPEKVVQWINGHAERAGEQEAQQFGSNVQQTAQSGAQAGGQALQQGAQAQQQRGQQMSDLAGKQFGLHMTEASKTTEFTQAGAQSAIEARQGKEKLSAKGSSD